MFNFIQNKFMEKTLKKLEKELKEVNYSIVRHELMKMKWEALRENDNDTYTAIEQYEKLVDDLEEIFSPKKGDIACQ